MKPAEIPKDGVFVVIPHLGGSKGLAKCLDSLLNQTLAPQIIVVDNASQDDSLQMLAKAYPSVHVIRNSKNRGFAGGVNPGIKKAMTAGVKYVATFNNDAIAAKDWLEKLVACLEENPDVGIAVSKILSADGKSIDSTGELYTSWGLPYPRGRRQTSADAYDHQTHVFGGSGGASLYRVRMLEAIGLFDEDFFAYYEDVDLSFRARLAGWEACYVPAAVVHHEIGATSRRISGFVTKQTMRNLPMLIIKDLPLGLWPTVVPRFALAYAGILFSSAAQGKLVPALAGLLQAVVLVPKKLVERRHINQLRTLSAGEVSLLLVRDLPPDAKKLRSLRASWWQILGRRSKK